MAGYRGWIGWTCAALLLLGAMLAPQVASGKASLVAGVGLEVRSVTTEFEPYFDGGYRWTEEKTDLMGLRGHVGLLFPVGTKMEIGACPSVAMFFSGDSEIASIDEVDVKAAEVGSAVEASLPGRLDFRLSEKLTVTGAVGFSYLFLSLQEPSGLVYGHDRELYEGGADFNLLQVFFAPGIEFDLSPSVRLTADYRLGLFDAGSWAGYADEPSAATHSNNGFRAGVEFVRR